MLLWLSYRWFNTLKKILMTLLLWWIDARRWLQLWSIRWKSIIRPQPHPLSSPCQAFDSKSSIKWIDYTAFSGGMSRCSPSEDSKGFLVTTSVIDDQYTWMLQLRLDPHKIFFNQSINLISTALYAAKDHWVLYNNMQSQNKNR